MGTGHRHAEKFLDVLGQYGGPASIEGADLGLDHGVSNAAATVKQRCEQIDGLLGLLCVHGLLDLTRVSA